MSYSDRVRRPMRFRRSPGLLVTASSLVLAIAALAPRAASAADRTANDEASLRAAITSANADVAATSSITLTSNITVTAALPALTRSITLQTGGFTLTGGAFNSSGALDVRGTGQARLNGVGALGGDFTVTDATLRLEGGGKLTTAGVTRSNVTANLIVDGAGSVLTTGQFFASDAAGSTSSVTIQNGGVLHATLVDSGTNALVGTGTGASGRVTVTGAGSRFDADGRLGIGSLRADASGEVIVSNGGAATVHGFLQMGQFSQANPAVLSHLLISGPGAILNADQLRLYKGNVEVVGGARAILGLTTQVGTGTASLLISGAGSRVDMGALQLGLTGTTVGNSTLTLADGGVLNAAAITLSPVAAHTSIINIGGGEAAGAAAAGALNATSIAFGVGPARLNFNHTDANYVFATPITGSGAINQVAGVTHLTGNNAASPGPPPSRAATCGWTGPWAGRPARSPWALAADWVAPARSAAMWR